VGQRRRARELAFLALYQSDLLGEPAVQRLNELVGEQPRPPELVEFARLVVESVDRHRAAVDRAIREAGSRWELERMSATDRAVLRQAVVELYFVPGVPEAVSINEAVEIAKRYGGDASGRFVNGVLDAIRRRVAAGAGGELEIEGAPPESS
jgi:transcription antitermination factor NusB